VYAAVNEKIIITGDCHVDSRNTKKVPNSRHLSSARSRKDDCCCEGACETQTEQPLPESGNRYSWVVNGMDCAACARKVENAVKQVPGVSVQVLFATEKLLVSADNDISKQVEAAVSKAGTPCAAKRPGRKVLPCGKSAAYYPDHHDGPELGLEQLTIRSAIWPLSPPRWSGCSRLPARHCA
jgi:copper chaperone CopZ